MKKRAWSIGDAIEVGVIELLERTAVDDSYVTCPGCGTEFVETQVFWRPATVCGRNPLAVAFADGTRMAIHKDIPVRRPGGKEER